MNLRTVWLGVSAAILCMEPAVAQKAKTEKSAVSARGAVKAVLVESSKPLQEPQIDFDDLIAIDAGGSHRTIYAAGAANQINEAVESYGESHNAAMQRKRASASSGSGGSLDSSASRSSNSSSSARSSSGSKAFVCTYKCTNASFTNTEKTTMTVRVKASDASSARDEAVKYARSTCYEQTRRVLDTGSTSCREQ